MKADLHLHSRFSQRAPEWLFRRAGLAASYSEPAQLYDALRSRGMDFVTLTDYDTIEGCLSIADRPGAFISEQITASFPEDRCMVGVLAWGFTENHHRELQYRRENIYELQRYLVAEKIAHGVAHPLFRLDARLTVSHLERLLLLFSHFQGINGLRDHLFSSTTQQLLATLTPEKLTELADRHTLAPADCHFGPKVLFGGSEDFGSLTPGVAWTEALLTGATLLEFLQAVQAGQCRARGEGGTPLTFAHGVYNNLRRFIGGHFAQARSSSLVGKAFSRFMEGEDPTEFSWSEKIGFVAQGISTGKIFELAKPANASLWRLFADAFSASQAKDGMLREVQGIAEPERRAFNIANHLTGQLCFRIFTSFVRQVSSGNIIEAIREISLLLPVLGTLAPYLYGFQSQAPDRSWLRAASQALTGEVLPRLRNNKRAWFTDTLEDVNGVATTIRRLTAAAVAEGFDLTVVTSRSEINVTGIPIKNFTPIGEFELPEYELQKLSFPPVLQMLEYIQREGITEVIISTPGPIGLTALLAAKMLGLRTSGIYHTDFPQYVRILSDDSSLETLAWNYMRWFYDQVDTTFVNSEGYREAWIKRGIAPEKLHILPRGLDTQLFHPGKRDPHFWLQHGAFEGAQVLLYVGRISKEKDLDLLITAWEHLSAHRVVLALVGEGPYARELRQALPSAIFTGALHGEELAQAFASADLLVFPSTTDTFGNVVIEALASGLPCIVSAQGGPKDLIASGQTGLIARPRDALHFAEQVNTYLSQPAAWPAWRQAARTSVENRDWTTAARRFWAVSPE